MASRLIRVEHVDVKRLRLAQGRIYVRNCGLFYRRHTLVESAEKEEPVDILVETDSRILEMVQKELSQEYLRLVTRSMRAGPQEAASDPTLPASLHGAGRP
jgi:hypothetical protein